MSEDLNKGDKTMSIRDLHEKIKTMETAPGQWWKPTEIGAIIAGKIKSIKYIDGEYGKNLVIELEGESGEVTMVSCKTVIERELESKKAKPGDLLALIQREIPAC